MASVNSPITTHVLDTSTGKPAVNMELTLHRLKSDGSWEMLRNGYLFSLDK